MAQARTDILIVASHAPELAGLRAYLSDALIGQVRGLQIRAKPIGMGMAAAASATARGILATQPRAVILLGTCGVYPNLPQYRPHDVVVAGRVQLIDHAVAAGKAAFPPPMQQQIETHPLLVAGLRAVGGRTFVSPVASPLARTTDDVVASGVHPRTGCEVENLEAFAIAVACNAAEVPFTAVMGVSNIVGSTGDHDWRMFQRDAVTRAAEALIGWVQQGAAGLPHP
jgi:nucleoside phosphorylase